MSRNFTTNTNVNIGPGVLQTGDNNPFILSTQEWIAVQKYVQDALGLPLTLEQMRQSLGVDTSVDISMFQGAIDAYKDINTHCSTWKNSTYPSMVTLANDIVHYNTKVPVYYNGLQKVVDQYNNNPTDVLLKEIMAIITSLANDANTYANNAAQVVSDIKTYADNTATDKSVVSTLRENYDTKYGDNSQEIINLRADITAQQLIVESADAEYRRDVIIASTTPTYLLVPVFGWIAAAVVAGVYGHKAVEALHEKEEAQAQVDKDNELIKRDYNQMTMIINADKGLNKIMDDINAALPIIQKIQGAWTAINSDLNNLLTIINEDIKKALPILMNLGIQEAEAQWSQLAKEADAYRVNAFVDFQQPGNVA